jgi:hypothetical protein
MKLHGKSCSKQITLISFLSLIMIVTNECIFAGDALPVKLKAPNSQETYPVFPQMLDKKPNIPSPFVSKEGDEFIVICTSKNQYSIVPVTLTNKGSTDSKVRSWGILTGNQLHINEDDFPSLNKHGLHDEKHLKGIQEITWKPVDYISEQARPKELSMTGFISEQEDVVSVLICDNRIMSRLGLNHQQTARCLFHIYNLIVQVYKHGQAQAHWDHREFIRWKNYEKMSEIRHVFYNRQKISITIALSIGFQNSIFNDEIRGTLQIDLARELKPNEEKLLKKKYGHLRKNQFEKMIKKITHLHFSEMAPYYIMRYGFYEGHTEYRAEPIAIAWLFGIKSLEDIERAFSGRLYETLTEQFTKETIK